MSTVSPLNVPRRAMLTVPEFEARFGEIRAMTSAVVSGRDYITSAVTKTHYVYWDNATQSYITESR